LSTTVTMPQLGETVTEGTILKWAKTVGESIVEDEVLVEISTDKVDTEVPSPASGTILEILVDEGDTIEVGTPMVVIGGADEPSATGVTPVAEQVEPVAEAAPEPVPTVEELPAAAEEPVSQPSTTEVEAFFAEPDEADTKPHLLSPVVRKLIRENEIDVTRLTGTGQGGRITRGDVEAYLVSAPVSAPPVSDTPVPALEPEVPVGRDVVPAAEPVAAPQPVAAPAPVEPTVAAPHVVADAGSDSVELDRIRILIAENMIKAKQTAAHVWTSVEVDFERVERVRQAHTAEFKADEGFSLTYLPFISRATIDALKAFPVVNSSFNLEEKTATFHKTVHLGIAIDLNQGGLVVAKVRNADGLRLVGIARSVRELAEKGREGKLALDDLTGSTFTITNPGPFGSFMSAPIINVPNVAILSTDTVTKRPTVVTAEDGQDMIAIRHIGYLGLTWDHRAFDGSTAVLFLSRIKENLESWDWEQELA